MRAAAPILERFAALGLIQSAVVLAAQAFMALFPLLIVFVALAPTPIGNAVAAVARKRLGFVGQTSDNLNSLVASRDSLQGGISVISVIIILASATSFTRALQRTYENSWQLPRMGMRGSARGITWLLSLVVYLSIIALTFRLTSSQTTPVPAIRLVLSAVEAFILWWFTPFMLLCGRVQLRALVPTGALTAISMLIAGYVSEIIMPRMITSNEQQFGTIGVLFAIQSWLVVIGTILVVAAILGAMAAQAGGRLGEFARGTADPDGWRRSVMSRWAKARQARRAAAEAGSPEQAADPEPPESQPAS